MARGNGGQVRGQAKPLAFRYWQFLRGVLCAGEALQQLFDIAGRLCEKIACIDYAGVGHMPVCR